jgi:hypothetical protein
MDSKAPEDLPIRFDEVYRETEPIAVIKLQPHELSLKNKELKFYQGYDDLDYLEYARLEVIPGCTIALISHQNTPIPGTDICVAPNQPRKVSILAKTISALQLFRPDLLWIHPDYERQLQKIWLFEQMKRRRSIPLFEISDAPKRRSRSSELSQDNSAARILPRQRKSSRVIQCILMNLQPKKNMLP